MKQFSKEEIYAYEEEISELKRQTKKLRIEKKVLQKQLDLHIVGCRFTDLENRAFLMGYDKGVKEKAVAIIK